MNDRNLFEIYVILWTVEHYLKIVVATVVAVVGL